MPTCHVFEFARSAINSSKVICQESDRFLETLETPLNTPMEVYVQLSGSALSLTILGHP